jgi:GT2 family glycosyltransferase
VPEATGVLLLGAEEPWRDLLGTPDESTHGIHVYRRGPAAWRDPTAGDARYHEQRPWASVPRRIALPDRMPSGRPWPRITVVTPTFNQAAFLEQTMQSVLRQDYPDLEYIVVDGGSEDGTRAILDRHRKALAHCIAEKDEGQADALNKGFRLATGEILAWLNSDDRYAAGALWRVALAFDAFGADMVAGACRLVQDGSDEPVRTHRSALPIGRVVPLPADRILDLDGSWLKGDFFFQPEVFWTRALWERSGARLATELYYSMDYELWVRMARAGARVVHVPDLLAVYRMHGQQKTAGEHLPYLPELRRVAARLQQEEAAVR